MGEANLTQYGAAGAAYEYVGQEGAPGSGNGRFQRPTGVAVASNGSVYVADAGNNRLPYLKRSGKVKAEPGEAGESGVAPTSLGRVKALFN